MATAYNPFSIQPSTFRRIFRCLFLFFLAAQLSERLAAGHYLRSSFVVSPIIMESRALLIINENFTEQRQLNSKLILPIAPVTIAPNVCQWHLETASQKFSPLPSLPTGLSFWTQVKQDKADPATRQSPQQRQQPATQRSREEISKEVEDIEKSLTFLRGGKPSGLQATAFLLAGYKCAGLGDKHKAISYFTEALTIARTLKDTTLEVNALTSISMMYASQGEIAIAIKFLDQALPILQSKQDKLDQAVFAGALNTACRVYFSQGDKQKALRLCAQALEANRASRARQMEVLTLGSIGAINNSMGQSKEALDYYNQALLLSREIKATLEEAGVLTGIGAVYDSLGQWEKALDYYNQSLLLRRATNDREGEAVTLNNIASIHDKLGDKQKAIALYNQALQIETDDPATLNNLGLLYASLIETHKALTVLDKALASVRVQKDRRGEAITLVNIGSVYEILDEHKKVLNYFNQALPIFRELQDPRSEAATLHNIGKVYTSIKEKERATDNYNRALQIRQTIGDRQGEAHTLSGMGVIYEDSGDKSKALESFNQALLLMREVGDRAGEAMVLDNMGHVYFSLDKKEKALESFVDSLSTAKIVGDRRRISSALSNIADIYEAQGDLLRAAEYYQQSLEADEEIRSEARLEEFKTKLADRSAATYLAAIVLNMRLSKPEQAFAIAERVRARTFLDQLGNSHIDLRGTVDRQLIEQEQRLRSEISVLDHELVQEQAKPSPDRYSERIQSLSIQLAAKQNEYVDSLTRLKLTNPEYASLVSVSPLTLSDIQKLLDEDTTLLSYIVTPSKTVGFVITRRGFQAVELKVSEKDLQAAVAWFRQFADLDELPTQVLKQLYNQLIAPLKGYLKTHKLGIIPHGTLHYFPFASLTDGQRYLGDTYQIFYLPSASALAFIQQKPKLHSERLLAGAQQQAAGLPVLHHAVQEAKSIAELYHTQALINEYATESAFRTRAGDYDILFLAAHGQLNQARPLFSRIILAPDKEADGYLEVHEVYSLKLVKTNLVVLSACETQMGERSRGDDIVGLNRAFIYAGASSVIASLWRVDDEATRILMKSFFTHLQKGMSKAAALQMAQRETRTKYPHPYYWAAFVLTGASGSSSLKK